MGFREHLEAISRVEGALAAVVMGFDGIAVEQLSVGESPVDANALLVEFAAVVGQLRRGAETVEAGEVREVAVATEKALAVFRPLTAEYFVALLLAPDGNFGKARFLLRLHGPRLEKEF